MRSSVVVFVFCVDGDRPVTSSPADARRRAGRSERCPGGTAVLTPTIHPPLPRELSQLWLAPDRGIVAYRSVASGTLQTAVKLIERGDYTKALNALSQPTVRQGPLGLYAAYYTAVAQLRAWTPDRCAPVVQGGARSEAARIPCGSRGIWRSGRSRRVEQSGRRPGRLRTARPKQDGESRRGVHAPRPGGASGSRAEQGRRRVRSRVLRVRPERARIRSGRAARAARS